MTHLALFIAIGIGALFKRCHRLERVVEPWSQCVESITVQMHAADIKPHAEIIVKPDELTKALPLHLRVVGAEIREAHFWCPRPLSAEGIGVFQ